MKKRINHRSATVFAAVALAVIGMSLVWAAGDTNRSTENPPVEKPAITITKAPKLPPGDGPMGDIAGTVAGVLPADYKVVVYAYGDRWYVQPWVALPLTAIEKDGSWATSTHGGHEYAALLVTPAFKPPSTMFSLPKVGEQVLAVTRIKPRPE